MMNFFLDECDIEESNDVSKVNLSWVQQKNLDSSGPNFFQWYSSSSNECPAEISLLCMGQF